ncbi:MAG: NAD(+)/NADH kinase [Lachnospiraceae bacterium]|jgi:NAD+ kinase|nr:NAD(+)/NADH kinase [Lachnospiraceae bacterium]
MDRFLIITNTEKDKDLSLTKRIASYIQEAGKQAAFFRLSSIQERATPQNIPEDIECAVVLGGDGTIIKTANDLIPYDIPILGVNLGTIGFLAEIEEHHVAEALDCLFQDDYHVESRLMISGEVIYNRSNLIKTTENTSNALNDIVITRKGLSRIIRLGIYVNDQLVDNFRGDGVIISTPTGSTAYNLSAGGPIVISQANVMVITPICPHSLSPRSLVVSAEDTVKVVVGKSKKTQDAEAIVSFDGNKEMELRTDDIIYIKKAQYDTKLIKLNHTGIYEILQSKLNNKII